MKINIDIRSMRGCVGVFVFRIVLFGDRRLCVCYLYQRHLPNLIIRGING